MQAIRFGSQLVEFKIIGITEVRLLERLLPSSGFGFRSRPRGNLRILVLSREFNRTNELGDMSIGIIDKQQTIDAMESLMEQQQGFFIAIQFLGIVVQ